MLACNAAAVLAMLVALTQRGGVVVDATLRHYIARSTAAGARDEALSRLHSSARTVRHPPLPPDDAFAAALEEKRLSSSMADIPESTLRAFLDPPGSTLDRAARGDIAAGALGDSGEDELHVLLRARETPFRAKKSNNTFTNTDAGDARAAALRATCELQRAVERARGYENVCRKSAKDTDTNASSCVRPLSALDARAAYETVGLGGVLRSLGSLGVRLGSPRDPGAFERARETCLFHQVASSVGDDLCADPSIGAACDARGCDAAIHPARRRCVVAGFVEACALLAAMRSEDVETLRTFHETHFPMTREMSTDDETRRESCDVVATSARAVAGLRLGAAFRRWAEAEAAQRDEEIALSEAARREYAEASDETDASSSVASPSLDRDFSIESFVRRVSREPGPLATLAAPWSLLVDQTFFRDDSGPDARDAPSFRTSRVIFFLDGSNAARWVLEHAAPAVIEPFKGTYPHRSVAASWHQVSASKALQTAALWRDARWAAGSLGVTALFVALHANDFVLAFGAMTAVSASLVAAHFAYTCVFRIAWVGALNFLGCFVIFAVGADDAFVLVEFWRKSANEIDTSRDASSGVLLRRMRWTLQKSGYVVTMTSATTALAFAGNLASSVTPLRLFGAYMAALVACDYWLVCTSVPSLLVLQERKKRRGNEEANDASSNDRVEDGGLAMESPSRRPSRDDAPASPSASPSAPPLFPPPNSFPARDPFAGSSAARPRDPASILVRRSATVGTPLVARQRRGHHPSRLCHRRTRSGGGGSDLSRGAFRLFSGSSKARREALGREPRDDDEDGGFPRITRGSIPHRRSRSETAPTFATPPERRASTRGAAAPGDVVLDFGADVPSDDDFATPRARELAASARTASPGDSESVLASPRESVAGVALVAPSRRTSSASASAERRRTPPRAFRRFRDAGARVSLEAAAFATLRRGGAECVVAVAFACVLAAALVARRAAPPEMASATATAFAEDANAKAFRIASEAFFEPGGAFGASSATRVAFVFGARDPGVPVDDETGVFETAFPDAATSRTLKPLASFLDGASRGGAAVWARVAKPLRDPDVAVGGGGAPAAAPPAFDDAFDIAHPDTQLFLLRFCAELRALAVGAVGAAPGGGGSDDGRRRRVARVSCFADALDARLRALSGGGARLPLDRGAFESAARTVLKGEDLAFSGLRWWSAAARYASAPCTGERKNQVATVEVRVATTTSPATSRARGLRSERAFWEAWFANATADAPMSLGVDKGFVTSRTWALLDTEAELVLNAWSALGASLACAFGVVFLAARSARLAGLATLSVGAVAASFVAFLVATGHTMGVAESACVAVLVGLSLDYVLHVAGAFAEAPDSFSGNRRRRAFWATRATRGSVFAGASTTAAAAAFLLFKCDAPFFRTFGAFALWTAAVSSAFAVVVFPATCALWGHEARDARERRRA